MGFFQDSSHLAMPDSTFNEVHGNMHCSNTSTTVNNIYFFGSDGVQVINIKELLASAAGGIVASDDPKTQDPKTITDSGKPDSINRLVQSGGPTSKESSQNDVQRNTEDAIVVDSKDGNASTPISGELSAGKTYKQEDLPPGTTAADSQPAPDVTSPSRPTIAYEPNLTPSQISFTIALKNVPAIEGSAQKIDLYKVVWQVFDVDSQNCFIKLNRPTCLGFGTVGFAEDSDEIVQSNEFLCGPPGSLVTLVYENGAIWIPTIGIPEPNSHFKAQNETGVPRKFAIGSYDVDLSRFQPFLVTGKIPNGGILSVKPQLVVQAYMTENIQAGQMVTDSVLSTSAKLFDGVGIDVQELQQVTTCRARAGKRGGITLAIEETA